MQLVTSSFHDCTIAASLRPSRARRQTTMRQNMSGFDGINGAGDRQNHPEVVRIFRLLFAERLKRIFFVPGIQFCASLYVYIYMYTYMHIQGFPTGVP